MSKRQTGTNPGGTRTDARGPALKHPTSLSEFINYRLYHVTRTALAASALQLRATAGVSRREWRMLSFLGEQPGTRLTELAASAGLDKVLASRAVHILIARGLVRRDTRAQDRRAAAFALTEEGEAVYRQAFDQARLFNACLADCLDDAEAELLSRCLDKLQTRAAALLAEAPARPRAARGLAADPLHVWR